jgi:hypothetical protein
MYIQNALVLASEMALRDLERLIANGGGGMQCLVAVEAIEGLLDFAAKAEQRMEDLDVMLAVKEDERQTIEIEYNKLLRNLA